MIAPLLAIAVAASAAGAAISLDQSGGVWVAGLALAYAAFERALAQWQLVVRTHEDAAATIKAMSERVAAIESDIAKFGLRERLSGGIR